jgi:alkanesulfonate monooxygenase SsuD/methylene tetrahydromethanopterin reductase-like flavin-dependent oxidoreductase (luciferase family)
MRYGFLTLGDLTPDPTTGQSRSAKQRLDEIIDAAMLAESLGLDSYTVGEHHSARWAVTSPPVVLAAIAMRTHRIRLRTGVTLMPNLDPVRVAEDYATVDVLSDGRLELTIGKGNFPEPWSLFGQDRAEQRERMAEGVELLLKIWESDPVTWTGRFRPPLQDASVGPRPLQSPPPVWWGVSTGPESADFAADRGLPIVIAGVIRSMDHCGAIADHYRLRGASAGHPPEMLQIASVSHLFVREDGDRARREFEPYYRRALEEGAKINPLLAMEPFDYEEKLRGPLVCGSPEEVVAKLASFHRRYRHDVHLFHADFGGLPWPEVARTMELFVQEVAPALEAEIERSVTVG